MCYPCLLFVLYVNLGKFDSKLQSLQDKLKIFA